MSYWLLKTEPGEYSIDDLERDGEVLWEGVRNYQARNFLRQMKKSEEALIYHSSSKEVGVAGLALIKKEAVPDKSQFDKKSPYYDPKSPKEEPRWVSPLIGFKKKFKNIIPLAELRSHKALSSLELLKKGSRLSVQPVKPGEFKYILKLADKL